MDASKGRGEKQDGEWLTRVCTIVLWMLALLEPPDRFRLWEAELVPVRSRERER